MSKTIVSLYHVYKSVCIHAVQVCVIIAHHCLPAIAIHGARCCHAVLGHMAAQIE